MTMPKPPRDMAITIDLAIMDGELEWDVAGFSAKTIAQCRPADRTIPVIKTLSSRPELTPQ